jgi:hypothetical protein
MVVGVNLIAVWAAAAAGGRMAPPQVAPPESPVILAAQAVEEAHASLLAAAERLDMRARRAVPAGVSRDLFRFSEPTRAGSRRDAGSGPGDEPPGVPVVAAPPPAPEPDIVLQGMAESGEGEGLVRTAILRAGSELVLATVGARIGGRYEVVAIGADSVEFEDVVDHQRRTCRMK